MSRQGDHWTIGSPELVGETSRLFSRLQQRSKAGGSVLAGFDFPIGLPTAYGSQTGFSGFREALQHLGTGKWSTWYDVAEKAADVSLYRPFYPMRPGGTARKHLLDGLGTTDPATLLRVCARATAIRSAACMLFWTLGGNQVGTSAIAGWREVIVPNLDMIGLWPFDGALVELLARFPVTIVETYPGDVYGQIGIPRHPRWSKRSRDGRKSVAGPLLRWIEDRGVTVQARLVGNIAQGFSPGAEGEDQFDAFVGLLGMLDVIDRHRMDGAPDSHDIRNWEGWIFGQAEYQQAATGPIITLLPSRT